MPVNRCRVCGHAFYAEPLLRYAGMPGAAQHLPDEAGLAAERGVDLEVCQCSGCGLVQLSNDPVPYYREVIRASAFSAEMGEFRRNQFAEFVAGHCLHGKKVIELGCGHGEYLRLMRDAGVDAYGIEYGEEAVRQCVAAGLQVRREFLDRADRILPDGPFDAFFIMNYLEHLPDPNAALGGIGAQLNPGGIGLVEVPNFDMILSRGLFSEFIGDHLFYFTGTTLRRTLEWNGYEVLSCDTVWHDYILSAVAVRRDRTDLSGFRQQREKLRDELAGYIARSGRTAIWGAGHQALAVMALADLAGKICYVVDSAPFKQGRFTPATHLPIVPPERLNADPPDAVIIMAAAYSDEVARIVREKFSAALKVAVLRDHGLEEVP